jgi:hypothetical protein
MLEVTSLLPFTSRFPPECFFRRTEETGEGRAPVSPDLGELWGGTDQGPRWLTETIPQSRDLAWRTEDPAALATAAITGICDIPRPSGRACGEGVHLSRRHLNSIHERSRSNLALASSTGGLHVGADQQAC